MTLSGPAISNPAGTNPAGTNPAGTNPAAQGAPTAPAADLAPILAEIRSRLRAVPDRVTLSAEEMRVRVERELSILLRANGRELTTENMSHIRQEVLNDLLGFGPLQGFLDDPQVTEIMVNGPDLVFIETEGRIHLTGRRFEDLEHLRRVIDQMVRTSGRRVDQASPMVDARLPDGSRLNVILPPLSVDGPAVTIRKFSSTALSADNLVASGSLSADAATFLERCVQGRLNLLVSGGTGTGKTTMLNILSSFIGRTERVVTVEDAVELTLQLDNLVRLETRPPNSEGAGEVVIRDLVRNALRMRPDRIVVGEVRGAETIDMLQAMNTGHEGSLSTVHANSPRDGLRRLETMVLLGGVDLPLRAIREQVASSIDMVVHLTRDATGRRYVQTITEVVGMEGEVVSTAELFARTAPDAALVPTALRSARLGTRRLAPAAVTP